ncbi:hypothetical protein BS47DRAFT_1366591 [Hydnum rufescens UP504]|uniref:Uncharacterized protein n=1 Tax=Hydnum rufescens UP504 TaxID=1448309 RepID=A0A9P6DQM4_9AGAM|nr:hypothetical protein BS47DRAFT_1366591 [Hydnum rufescens UP504]
MRSHPSHSARPLKRRSMKSRTIHLPKRVCGTSRSGPGQNTGTTQPPIPQSSISGNIYEDETNTAPHTRFERVCGNIRYLHCPISDSTNADQVQSKTRDRAAPHTPTLDFPQQRNTKQIRRHTPASAGYHTIDTARDIPPLKTG